MIPFQENLPQHIAVQITNTFRQSLIHHRLRLKLGRRKKAPPGRGGQEVRTETLLTEVGVGGGGEPEEEGADEQHHRDAVHGARQRPRPRRLPPPRRRQRVVRRQRRLAHADAAAISHARPARRPPHIPAPARRQETRPAAP